MTATELRYVRTLRGPLAVPVNLVTKEMGKSVKVVHAITALSAFISQIHLS